MDTYKKLNIALSAGAAILAAVVWLYWEVVCTQNGCSSEMREYIFRPFLWSTIPLAIILVSLLNFPSKLFKQWLFYVASWSIPLSIYFVLEQDSRQFGPFGIGRSELAWGFGTLIFLLTVVYAIFWYLYEWKKGRLQISEFSRLAVFAIVAAIFYRIWELF